MLDRRVRATPRRRRGETTTAPGGASRVERQERLVIARRPTRARLGHAVNHAHTLPSRPRDLFHRDPPRVRRLEERHLAAGARERPRRAGAGDERRSSDDGDALGGGSRVVEKAEDLTASSARRSHGAEARRSAVCRDRVIGAAGAQRRLKQHQLRALHTRRQFRLGWAWPALRGARLSRGRGSACAAAGTRPPRGSDDWRAPGRRDAPTPPPLLARIGAKPRAVPQRAAERPTERRLGQIDVPVTATVAVARRSKQPHVAASSAAVTRASHTQLQKAAAPPIFASARCSSANLLTRAEPARPRSTRSASARRDRQSRCARERAHQLALGVVHRRRPALEAILRDPSKMAELKPMSEAVRTKSGNLRARAPRRGAPTVALRNWKMMASTSSGEAGGLGAPSPGRTSPPEAPSRGAGDDAVSRRRLSASSSDVIAKAPHRGRGRALPEMCHEPEAFLGRRFRHVARLERKRGDASGQDSRQPLGFEILS